MNTCAPPVIFQVHFDCTVYLSLQIRYSGITGHWPIYPSITCKFFLHRNQKYSIFRPNTTVYHTKLLCLDWIYRTSDYTESTAGMSCPKIIFFSPKTSVCNSGKFISYMYILSLCWKFAQVILSCVTVERKHSTEQCRDWYLYLKGYV